MSERVGPANERIARLEEQFKKLAEEVGLVKIDQNEMRQWRFEHEKREVTMHAELMASVTSVGAGVELIKADIEKRDADANSKSSKRKENFDRIVRIALAIVVLVGALSQLYNWVRSLP